ncbi:MAG: histidine phosphatase family protein [Actinomycetota bacterium]|nr:histidine phosphatase family protein [Actinomycetota bacterium]
MTNGSTDVTVVHLLRHGEVANPRGILYGRLPDFHLSELGHKMAERAAGWFAARDVAHLVSSPLERAQETAAPTAAALALEVHVDDRVIEAGNQFEGKTFGVGDGALWHPTVWWRLRNPFSPSWGEPYAAIAARMMAAAGDAREAARGREAVIVSHQLPVWIARCAAEGRRFIHDPRRRQCALTSVTSISYTGDAVQSVAYTEPAADLLVPADDQQFGA